MFTWLAWLLWVAALGAWSPFLWDWAFNGDRSGHLQSVVLGGVLLMSGLQCFALGVIADLIAAHRSVSQLTLERVRRLELQLEGPPSPHSERSREGQEGVGRCRSRGS